jgi:hypothetical protein
MVNKQDLQELAKTIIVRSNEGSVNLRRDLQKDMQEMNEQLRKDVANMKTDVGSSTEINQRE